MAFSLTLKRTFEEVIDVSCTTDQPDDDAMSFRIPVKRQKLQVTPRKIGLEYRELISLEGNPDGADQNAVSRMRLVTTSPSGLVTASPPRTYREVFPKEEYIAANPTINQTTFGKALSARSQACAGPNPLVPLLGQPVAGSACLNLNIPDYQTAAAALLSASPLRANEVPENPDDRGTGVGFSGRTMLPQLFQQRRFSVLKPDGSLCLWQTDNISADNTFRNGGFSDQRLLVDDLYMRRIGRNGGSVGARSRLSDRGVVGSEAELATIAEEETTVGPVEVCAECQKVFKRKVYLQRHMEREHWLPAKVFKCDDCKYETKHQSNLSVHRRTHTGERPYHCGACGQRYTQGHLLKSHIRSRHAGNLRFYNLDKRSDSTRGRKSLDFKHDIYLSLPSKSVPMLGSSVLSAQDASAIQAYTYQRERFSSYVPRLPNPPLTSWNLAGRSKMRRDWPNSYLAVLPQRATSDPLFLSTALGLPFFTHHSMNHLPNADLPVFQSDLTQLLCSDKKSVCQIDAYNDHLSGVGRRSGLMCNNDGQRRFPNDALVNVKAEDLELLRGRTSPPQSFPEDLTVTRRAETHHCKNPPAPDSPCSNGRAPQEYSNVDDDGRSPCLFRKSLPTTDHIEVINSKTNRMEPNEEIVGLKMPHLHPADDDISKISSYHSSEPIKIGNEKEEDVITQPEMTTIKEADDEAPTDLSIARQSPSCDFKNSAEHTVEQTNETSFIYPYSDDSSNSISVSSSSDTSAPLERRILPPEKREREAAPFEGTICPHFQKLQEFRRIVLRFVNAFAPNSIDISDKDESFAETDLIDEIVHAAMFNDVE